MNKDIQMIKQAKIEFLKSSSAGKYDFSADLRCFLVYLAKHRCHMRIMALNSRKRLKSNRRGLKRRKSSTPKICRQPCTANTAITRGKKLVKLPGDVTNRNHNISGLPYSAKIAKIKADYTTTTGGVFWRILTINSEIRSETGLCLSCFDAVLGQFVKHRNAVRRKGAKYFKLNFKMSANIEGAKYRARLLADGEKSDQEEDQAESKLETELDISMSTISYEESDGKINLQHSNRILRSNLNLSNGTNFLNFSVRFTDRRMKNTSKNSKPQNQAKPAVDRRFQIFIESRTFLRTENSKNKIENSQKLPEKDGPNTSQRSDLILNKIRITIDKPKLYRKIYCYLTQNLIDFKKFKITDSDGEIPYDEMTKEEQDQYERMLWQKKFPSGIPPYPTPFSPETDKYWIEWANGGTQENLDQNEPDEDMSSNISTRPAAIPKAAGRCKEGSFCQNLDSCSCIYDTSSNVSMGSPTMAQSQTISLNKRREGVSPGSASPISATGFRHSLNRCREGERSLALPSSANGLNHSLNESREGESRPGSPDRRYDPNYDFTIADLELQVGVLEDQDKPPSVIWTDASIRSTLPSVIETDPSVISTLPSIISTTPSILILDEVDWRFQCKCGEKMGLTERVATWEYLAKYPAPYVCLNCRWKTVGL